MLVITLHECSGKILHYFSKWLKKNSIFSNDTTKKCTFYQMCMTRAGFDWLINSITFFWEGQEALIGSDELNMNEWKKKINNFPFNRNRFVSNFFQLFYSGKINQENMMRSATLTESSMIEKKNDRKKNSTYFH